MHWLSDRNLRLSPQLQAGQKYPLRRLDHAPVHLIDGRLDHTADKRSRSQRKRNHRSRRAVASANQRLGQRHHQDQQDQKRDTPDDIGNHVQYLVDHCIGSDTVFVRHRKSKSVLRFGQPINILRADTKNVEGIARGEMILSLPDDVQMQADMKEYLTDQLFGLFRLRMGKDLRHPALLHQTAAADDRHMGADRQGAPWRSRAVI